MNWCVVALIALVVLACMGFYFLTRSVETYSPTVQSLSTDQVFETIKQNFLDSTYRYNLHNHPKRRIFDYDDYEDFVKDHVKAWNDLFDRDLIDYDDSKLIYGEVAGNEFYLDVEIEVEYNDEDYLIRANIYGDKNPNGDTLIQLTKMDVNKK